MTLTEKPLARSRRPPRSSDGSGPIRWSWAMVPTFLIVWVLIDSLLFCLLRGPLGLQEGEVLLMARSVAGWFAEVGSVLIVLTAPIAGVVFAATALQRGGRRGMALAAVVVNAASCLLTSYTFVDDIHVTYFPRWW